MQLPPPIRSFLASHDLKGKTVAPFKTHAGYGVGSGFEEINRLCKGCRVTPGLSLQGGRSLRLARASAMASCSSWKAQKPRKAAHRSGNGCPD